MIQYDPHRWLDHLFDVKGSLIPEITLRVSRAWSGRRRWSRSIAMPVMSTSRRRFTLWWELRSGCSLVFRTNSSYNRFWEGRQLWGSLVNETRNLARVARCICATTRPPRRFVIRWVGAFPYAVKNVLRGTDRARSDRE